MYFFVAANVAILIIGLVSIWLMRSGPRNEPLTAADQVDVSLVSSQTRPATATLPEPRLRAVDEHAQVVLGRTYVDRNELDSLFSFDSHLGGSDAGAGESVAGES